MSPDLKWCFYSERDETRQGWAGPGIHLKTHHYILNLETEERTPNPIRPFTDGRMPLPAEISPDQRYIVVNIGPGPLVYLKEGWKRHRAWTLPSYNDSHFSPDSRLLASFGGSGVRIWDIERDKLIASITPRDHFKGFKLTNRGGGGVEWVQFSPDSRYLWAYYGRNANLIADRKLSKQFFDTVQQAPTYGSLVWDLQRDAKVKILTLEQSERMEGFGPIPDTVLLRAVDGLELVDLKTGKEVARLMFPPGTPPQRYFIEGTCKDPVNRPWDIPVTKFHFRALTRKDGLVLGCYLGEDPYRVRTGPSYATFYATWKLGPHLEELEKRRGERVKTK